MRGLLYVGLDVGSSATKCVVLNDDSALLGHHVVASGFDYTEASEKALHQALLMAGGGFADVACCVSTGYGRDHVRQAHRKVTEISCHARGARAWCSDVHNIIDIGGQDTKVIRVDADGRLIDYRMNAKCAAGTGTFLEATAYKLGLSMAQLDALAMRSTSDTTLNSYCTVFAGTEIIERIKEGQPREDISMGLFRSIASRISEMWAARGGQVMATGGVATYCRSLIRALEEVLETDVRLPPMPQHAGAFGAALLARECGPSTVETKSHASHR